MKLCDFGLARMKNKLQKKNRAMLGTPNWMSPETLRGEDYEQASDVYSFGVIIW